MRASHQPRSAGRPTGISEVGFLPRAPAACSCCLPLALLRHFVFRLRDAHQPFIEPTDDVLEALDAMPGLA
jgi:hypothetical protein